MLKKIAILSSVALSLYAISLNAQNNTENQKPVNRSIPSNQNSNNQSNQNSNNQTNQNSNNQANQNSNNQNNVNKAKRGNDRSYIRDEVMEEDEIGGSDIFAIPLDDSAVEDEALMDRMAGKPYTPNVPAKNNQTNDANVNYKNNNSAPNRR